MSLSSQKPADHPTLRLRTVGLDERQRNALRMVIEVHGRKRCQLVEDDSAQAWVVDLDNYRSEEELGALRRQHGEKPLLLLSLQEPTTSLSNASVFLRKPLRIEDFLASLYDLSRLILQAPSPNLARPMPSGTGEVRTRPVSRPPSQAIEGSGQLARQLEDESLHTYVGNARDIDVNDPAQLAQIYYDPRRYLHSRFAELWRAAKQRGGIVQVNGPWPEIRLYPDIDRVWVAAGDQHLRPFCLMPDLHTEPSVAQLDKAAANLAIEASEDYDSVMWKMALWASRGRLPAETPLDVPVFLRRWPNFTRLKITPGALAIAALWSRQPYTLLQTAELLRLPQRHVFAFYSAAQSLDLAAPTRRAVDTLFEPPSLAAHQQRGLLRSLFDKLHFGRKS